MVQTTSHIFSGKVNVGSNLQVGSSHLFVDTTNNRVGITTGNPDASLHVNGNAYVESNVGVGSTIVLDGDTGIITATQFQGDGSQLVGIASNLEQIVENGNVTSNTVQFTNPDVGIVASGNVEVGNKLVVGSLTPGTVPTVASDNTLADSRIAQSVDTVTITSNLEVTGNIVMAGESYTIDSQSLEVKDRIVGIAYDNTLAGADTGILMEYPTRNVALVHHGASGNPYAQEFTIGYTQNTATDTTIVNDTGNVITVNVLGHLHTQNNMTVDSGGSYYGDGTKLTGVALASDLTSNTARIANLESANAVQSTLLTNLRTDVTSNASRVTSLEAANTVQAGLISSLETDLSSNASRVSTLEAANVVQAGLITNLNTSLSSNASRVATLEAANTVQAGLISSLETDLSSNASRVSTLEAANTVQSGLITSLETDLSSNASRVSTLEAANTVQAGLITDLTTDLASNDARITTLETDLTDNASRITTLETANTVQSGLITTLTTDLSSNDARVSTLETDLTSNASRIATMEVANTVQAGLIADLTTDLSSNASRVSTLEAANTVQSGLITSLETDLSSNASRVSTLDADLTDNASRVTALESTDALLSSLITDINTNLSDNSSRISNLTLDDVVNVNNATANTVQFTNAATGIKTTGNVEIGSNLSVSGLSPNKIPIVGSGNFLEDSLISKANGTIVISSDVEILGNISVDGNSYTIDSNSLVINDRIIGIANNNTSHELDVGIIMQHPGKNIALIHHGEAQGDQDPHDHVFTIGYTQNTVTDNHVFDDSNLITVEVLGNLITQNNLTVTTGSYFGDGTTLTGVALSTDLTDNAARITTLEAANTVQSGLITDLTADLSSNASRVTNLETDLTDNASRVTTLEAANTAQAGLITNLTTDLSSNDARVTTLETDLTSNASRVSTLEAANTVQAGLITDLTTDLSSNDARVTTLETDLTSNAARVTTLEAANTVQAGLITTLTTDLSSNDARVTTLETDLTDNAARITTLEAANTVQAGLITDLTTDLSSNDARVATLETDLTDNAARITTLESANAVQAGLITTLTTDLSSNDARVTTLETDLTSNAARVTTLEAANTVQAGLISTLNLNMTSNDARVTTLETDLTDNASRITTLEAANTVQAGLITGLATDLASNDARITTLESANTVQATLISDINTNLSANSVRVGTLETRVTNLETSNADVWTSLADNSSRIYVVSTDLSDNATRITNLETSNAQIHTDLADNSARISNLTLGDVTNVNNATSNTVQFTNAATSFVASGNVVVSGNVTSTAGLVSNVVTIGSTKRYVVTASGGVFYIDGVAQKSLELHQRQTYIFDQSDSTNATHPIRFSTTNNGTHGGGSEYTTGITHTGTPGSAGAFTTFVVSTSTPVTLYYYCSNHSGMGSSVSVSALAELVVTGRSTLANVDATNVHATTFIGDGSQLTGIASNLHQIVNNGNVTSNTLLLTNTGKGLVASGTVEASSFVGDGSQLTGIATTLQAVSDNGNVTSNTIQFTNTGTSLVASGTVEASSFVGDGSQLTGIATTLQAVSDNGNVTSNTIQFTNTGTSLVASGTVEAASFVGDGSQLTNLPSGSGGVWNTNAEGEIYFTTSNVGISNADPGHELSVGSNLYVDDDGSNVLVVTGNVKANYFVGNGSLLTNLPSGSGGVWSTNAEGEIYYTNSNVGIANADPGHELSVGSNLYVDDDGSNVLVVTGNILSEAMTLGEISIVPSYGLEHVVSESNVTAETIELTNPTTGLVADGNIHALKFIGDGSALTGIATTLQSVSDFGNVTTNTLQFSNATTSFVAASNVEINGRTTISGHIIPSVNNAYDVGSAERKIRDLYVDDNSLWVGDRAKISFSGGRMMFKRRKLNHIPRMVLQLALAHGRQDAAQVEQQAIAHAKTVDSTVTTLEDLRLEHWRDYTKSIDETKEVSDIFADNEDDYEVQTAADALKEVGSNIFTTNSFAIGKETAPTANLDVQGTMFVSSNLTVGRTVTTNTNSSTTSQNYNNLTNIPASSRTPGQWRSHTFGNITLPSDWSNDNFQFKVTVNGTLDGIPTAEYLSITMKKQGSGTQPSIGLGFNPQNQSSGISSSSGEVHYTNVVQTGTTVSNGTFAAGDVVDIYMSIYVTYWKSLSVGVELRYGNTTSTTEKDFFSIDAENSRVDVNTSNIYQDGVSSSLIPFTKGGAYSAWTQEYEVYASNRSSYDYFGQCGAVSGDGNTAVFIARNEDTSGGDSGAAYVYTYNGSGGWPQTTMLKASDAASGDILGESGISISHDGTRILVASRNNDDTYANSGSAYVFDLVSGSWSQTQKLVASNPGANDHFGRVKISGDGNIIYVAAHAEDGPNNTLADSGALYYFTNVNGTWTEQQLIRPSVTNASDIFGLVIGSSYDGATMVTSSRGMNSNRGAAFIFELQNGSYVQTQMIQASNGEAADYFGTAIDMSYDGNTVAVGAHHESGPSNATSDSGAVYVFEKSASGTWSETAILRADNLGAGDNLGGRVNISGNGKYIVAGARNEDTPHGNAGSVYVFRKDGTTWSQVAMLSNTDTSGGDLFGDSVGISSDGQVIVGGAVLDDVTYTDTGSAYIFRASSTTPDTFSLDGNVGIGVSNPTEALDIVGNLKLNGVTMSKPPKCIHIDDTRSGCPPSHAANSPIMQYTVTTTRTAFIYVSVSTILNHTSRADCSVTIGNYIQQYHLTASDSTSWNPVTMTAGYTVGPGSHAVTFQSTTANVVGCGSDWGGMQILVFET